MYGICQCGTLTARLALVTRGVGEIARGPAKASRSTALGMIVIFSFGMPRAVVSSRRP